MSTSDPNQMPRDICWEQVGCASFLDGEKKRSLIERFTFVFGQHIYVCIKYLFAELWFEMVIGVSSHVDTISFRCFSLVRVLCWYQLLKKGCKQHCCIQWAINHLVLAKIIQAASITHLSQDIISYNSAIAACEKGSRWQDTVLVDSAGYLIWLQKLQGSHSVMMTSFGAVFQRHCQQFFFNHFLGSMILGVSPEGDVYCLESGTVSLLLPLAWSYPPTSKKEP